MSVEGLGGGGDMHLPLKLKYEEKKLTRFFYFFCNKMFLIKPIK